MLGGTVANGNSNARTRKDENFSFGEVRQAEGDHQPAGIALKGSTVLSIDLERCGRLAVEVVFPRANECQTASFKGKTRITLPGVQINISDEKDLG